MKVENMVIPLGWVLTGFASTTGVIVVGAVWMAAVNFRLQRIEEKLGIPPLSTTAVPWIVPAIAGEKSHDDAKRLPESVRKVPAHQ